MQRVQREDGPRRAAAGAGGFLREYSHLLAGCAAGLTGLLVFLVVHHAWILPIWFIAPGGAAFASVGGILVGRAYAGLKPALPGGIMREASLTAAALAALLPSILIAELRQPLFTVSAGNPVLALSVAETAMRFILELLLPAALIGAGIGWHVGRSRRSAVSAAIACAIFALGPGHNIPFLGGSPVAGKGIAILIAVISSASFVLVELDSLLSYSG
jgi:hypothetical protein